MAQSTALVVGSLVKRFASESVLKQISFEIPEGQSCLLLGQNGAGKSTLMQILAGLRRADAGSISLYQTANCEQLRQRTLYCGHEHMLYEDLTLQDNFSLFAAKVGRTKVAEELQFWELETLLKKQVSHFSQGQKARASLARAFLQEKDLLLLDEPSAALDDHFSEKLHERIKQSLGTAIKIILIASHDITRMRSSASSALLLSNGVTAKHSQDIESVLQDYQRLNR